MGKNYKNLLVNILGILFIVPFYYIVGNKNIFLYVLSYSLYLILTNVFAHIDIRNSIKKYHNLEYKYSENKIIKKTILKILLWCLIIASLVCISGFWLEKIFEIEGLLIVYASMSLTIFIVPLLKVMKDYLEVHNYKKLSGRITNIYYLLNIICLLIISYLVFRIFTLKDYVSVSLLYTSHVISFIFIFILIYFFIIRKKEKFKIKREEIKINYKKEVKEIFKNNIETSIINIVKYSYYYISIIIIYLVLINRYGYSYDIATNMINVTYFYGLRLIFLIVIITMYLGRNILELVRENIKKQNYEKFSLNITYYLNTLLKILLTTVIVCSIISRPIWVLLFGNYGGSNTFGFLSFLSLFLVFYIIVIKMLKVFNNRKIITISLTSGIIIKLAFTFSLMSAFYRMGYNLIYGDIISSILAYFTSIIVGMIFINKKRKINFLKSFEDILTIVYENIILCVVLILLTLIIPTTVTSRIGALGVIIIYIIVSIIFYIILKIIKKLKKV